MSRKQVDNAVAHLQQANKAGAAAPPSARRRVRLIVGALLLSAGVFFILVAMQRDSRRKNADLERMRQAEAWIQKFLDERSYLPTAIPEEMAAELGAPEIPYPPRDELSRLRRHQGPFVLLASSYRRLIMSGDDGCAALVVDHGRISTRWLNAAELAAGRELRRAVGER